jgi:CRISPR-associated protein Csx10
VPVLNVTITALSPLVFSERRPDGQFRHSSPYVPGAVIRGALAQQFIDAGGEGTDEFHALFISSDAPLFRNAYPAHSDATTSSRPLPATAYSCKADDGFNGHGVFDGLIDRLCSESLNVVVLYLPRCNHESHGGRGERVETFGGFYTGTGESSKRSINVPTHLTTRVALNRRRRVAEDKMLYSPLVISEASEDGSVTTFHGSVVAHDHDHQAIKNRLAALTHVGSGVARGFGHVDIKVEVEAPETDDLHARVRRFNELVRKRWKLWEQLQPERKANGQDPSDNLENGTFFSIMLVSDAILREDYWNPTTRLTPEMLDAAGTNAKLLRCYAASEFRGGWNTAWRLPKDTELVARMGSVYVYHTTDNPEDEGWLSALRELEQRGIGERRREGFGQVIVCDDFHREIQEVN